MPRSRRNELERELAKAADPKRAKNLTWFFKTGKGEYGEGDRFIGLTVPTTRRIALRYRDLTLNDLAALLLSPIHEYRMAALEILVAQFERAREPERTRFVEFYLQQTGSINNWDLVDTSAPYILGEYLLTRPRQILDELASSVNIWERRIAIVATLAFLKKGQVAYTFRISERLLRDSHDLIHKATGWALREAGKVDTPALLRFLSRHYAQIPRTTLRYAIERFPREQRHAILCGKF